MRYVKTERLVEGRTDAAPLFGSLSRWAAYAGILVCVLGCNAVDEIKKGVKSVGGGDSYSFLKNGGTLSSGLKQMDLHSTTALVPLPADKRTVNHLEDYEFTKQGPRLLWKQYLMRYDLRSVNPSERLEKLKSLELDKVTIALDAAAIRDTQLVGYLREQKLSRLQLVGDGFIPSDFQVMSSLPSVKALSLAETNVSNKDLIHIGPMTQLEALFLDNTNVNDKGMQYLRGLPSLRILSLDKKKSKSKYKISNRGVAQLITLKNLEVLILNHNKITDYGAKQLKALTKLKTLEIGKNSKISNATLKAIGSLTSLTRLRVFGTKVSSKGLSSLKGLTQLHTLDLGNNKRIKDRGLAQLMALQSLRELDLNATGITNKGVATLTGLPGLTKLWLSVNWRLSDPAMRSLSALVNLEKLSVGNTMVTDQGMGYISGLTKLRHLWIERTKIGDAGFAHLRGMSNLTVLGAHVTQVTDAGLSVLSGLKELRKLSIRDTRVTELGLQSLSGLTNLRGLWLYNTLIGDAGLNALEGLSNLSKLSIKYTQVTQAGYHRIRSQLSGCNVEYQPLKTKLFDLESAANLRYGNSRISLKRMGRKKSGTASVITGMDGYWYLKGKQTVDNVTVKLDGKITEVGPDYFNFAGNIETTESYGYGGGDVCKNEGDHRFKIAGKPNRWRFSERWGRCDGVADTISLFKLP